MSRTHYRNPKILALAKGQDCQHCGINDDTIVAAHSNKIVHGKGVGIKADDFCIAYLCYKCHTNYDTGKMNQGEFNSAIIRTMKIWVPEITN